MSDPSPHAIETAIRHGRVLKLRLAGHSYSEIAEKLGFAHKSGVQYVLQSYLERLAEESREDIEAIRELENQRLDVMLAGIWKDVEKGKRDAIHTALKISERRARLNGLDILNANLRFQTEDTVIIESIDYRHVIRNLEGNEETQATSLEIANPQT